MNKFILIAGAATLLGAAPAYAGGSGGGLIGGVTGTVGGALGGTVQGTVGGLGGAPGLGGLGDCLCRTINGAVGKAGALANSVSGLGSRGKGGGDTGHGKGIGLAGVVSTANSVAATVTKGGGPGHGIGLAGVVGSAANGAASLTGGTRGVSLAGTANSAGNAALAVTKSGHSLLGGTASGQGSASANAKANKRGARANAGGSASANANGSLLAVGGGHRGGGQGIAVPGLGGLGDCLCESLDDALGGKADPPAAGKQSSSPKRRSMAANSGATPSDRGSGTSGSRSGKRQQQKF